MLLLIHEQLVLTESATFFSFGEVFEPVGGTSFCFLVLLDVPGQFGGDVSDEETAGSQTMIMAPHAKLTVLRRTANKQNSCEREHLVQLFMSSWFSFLQLIHNPIIRYYINLQALLNHLLNQNRV